MKVLLLSATFPPSHSGGADYAYRLCHQLVARQISVDVITSTPNPLEDGLHVHKEIKSWGWSELPKILRLVSVLQPDVINLHFSGVLYDDHPMITMLPALVRSVSKARFVTLIEAPIGVRVHRHSIPVRALHRALVTLAPNWVQYSFGSILSASDDIIVLNTEDRHIFERESPSAVKKISVIPPAVLMNVTTGDPHELRVTGRQKLGLNSSDFIIAYLGYIYPGKGLETLIQSFSAVRNQHSAKLLIMGGVPELVLESMGKPDYVAELHRLADDLHVGRDLIWTGGFATESTEPSLLLRAADLCVLPFDAGVRLNNSSFAACAAHGLPIITTLGPNTESVYKHEENVYLCRPKDSESLSEAILHLANDSAKRQQLGASAMQLAKSVFSWDSVMEKTLAVFEGHPPADQVR